MSSIETEQRRVAIFENLVEKLGAEQARYIMDNHPPGGWEQLATKDDLKNFATKDDLKAHEASTKEALKAHEASTKEALKAHEVSTKEALKALEVSTKQNLDAGLKEVRAEMAQGFADITLALAEIVERVNKTEARVAGVIYTNFVNLLVFSIAVIAVVVSLVI